jgi:hypothetical protein
MHIMDLEPIMAIDVASAAAPSTALCAPPRHGAV